MIRETKISNKENIRYVIAAILPVISVILLYVLAGNLSSGNRHSRMCLAATFYFLLSILLCLFFLFRSKNKLILIWPLSLVFISLFISDDALWPALLLWQKNKVLIFSLETLLLLLFGLTILRCTGLSPAALISK